MAVGSSSRVSSSTATAADSSQAASFGADSPAFACGRACLVEATATTTPSSRASTTSSSRSLFTAILAAARAHRPRIADYIEPFYNLVRLHGTLSATSDPTDFEDLHRGAERLAAQRQNRVSTLADHGHAPLPDACALSQRQVRSSVSRANQHHVQRLRQLATPSMLESKTVTGRLDHEEDRALFDAWRRGDRRAGSKLVDRHIKGIGRFFANKVRSETEIHDLVAETFRRCTEDLERFRGQGSVRAYLFAIANNVLREFVRRDRKERERLEFGSTSIADLGPSPSRAFAHREEERLLLAALRNIPLNHQVLFELSVFEELSRSEIAEITGLPEGTVASRLRRARVLLEAQLARLSCRPSLATSTTTDLLGWARKLRRKIYGRESDDRTIL